MFKKLAIIIAFFIVTLNAFSQGIQIRNIYIDNKRVFEPEDKDWFFGSEFLNFFHHTTQLYVIEDELLFDQNSVTDEEYIYETERSLRNSGFFAYSKIGDFRDVIIIAINYQYVLWFKIAMNYTL